MRVAYTIEQCWRRVPGGTGTSALEVLEALNELGACEMVPVAGRHRRPPTRGFQIASPIVRLPVGGALLVETWARFGWPLVESSVPDPDLVHTTTIIAPATRKPLVATIHDLAFLRHPDFFTARGNKVFRRSLATHLERTAIVMCSSKATLDDCLAAGFTADRLRHVPLGVRTHTVTDDDRRRVRGLHDLPDEYVLFVGTREPRKNLARLLAALEMVDDAPPLVLAGIDGWGETDLSTTHRVHSIGYVHANDLPALYSMARAFLFPSILEGYGLPVVEAMAHGAPVVTSKGTSTEEVAGGAAVLVDPLEVDSIAAGIRHALGHRDELVAGGLERAASLPWSATARATHQVYTDAVAG